VPGLRVEEARKSYIRGCVKEARCARAPVARISAILVLLLRVPPVVNFWRPAPGAVFFVWITAMAKANTTRPAYDHDPQGPGAKRVMRIEACVAGSPHASMTLRDLRRIEETALALVRSTMWSGMSDEDVALEIALIKAGHDTRRPGAKPTFNHEAGARVRLLECYA
jgi:hypothetical protein